MQAIKLTRAEASEVQRLLGKAGVDMPDTRGYGANGNRTPEDAAFSTYLRTGVVAPSMVQAPTETRDPTGFSEGSQPGQISGSGGTYGGYTVAQDFWQHMQVALRAYGGMAADFKQIDTPTGAIMPWPTINPTGVVASVITSELTQLNPDNPYVFGQGVLSAWTIATDPVLVSLQLANDSAFDLDAFIRDRFAESIGREVAALAVSGTGSSQPLGLITALAAGSAFSAGAGASGGGWLQLGTATAVKTFAGSTTELAANVLSPQTVLSMVAAIDPAYWDGAKFYLNATMALNQRGVVDDNGRPLLNLENGYADGAIGTMLGFPVVVDNNLPSLAASTVGGPVFGRLSDAMVQRNVRNGTSIMRLQERYADYLAIGYLGWLRTDIRSNDLRAAITCKPAAT
jgi:HK97 family phage major capsid protein